MIDVPLEIFHELRVRIICHNDMLSTVNGADETGETGPSTELENCFAANERACIGFKIGRKGAAGVPKEVALLAGMSTLGTKYYRHLDGERSRTRS